MGGQMGRPVRTAGRLVVRTGTVLSVVGGSLVVASAPASAATTLTVTNTADSGPGSLWQPSMPPSTATPSSSTSTPARPTSPSPASWSSTAPSTSRARVPPPSPCTAAPATASSTSDSTPGTVSISGLTIADGDASTNGGGVLVIDGTHLVLDGVDVSGNQADVLGGGVAAIDAPLDLRNSTVSGNTASGGGGLGVGGGSGVSIAATTFTANTADTTAPGPDGVSGLGGGAFLSYVDGEVSVTGSGFFGNQAAKYAGVGLSDITGTVTIVGTDIGAADPGAGNQAYLAGGLGLADIAGDLTVSDSSISGNTAEYGGGGFKYSDATIGDVAYIEANAGTLPPGICVLRHPDDPAHHRHGNHALVGAGISVKYGEPERIAQKYGGITPVETITVPVVSGRFTVSDTTVSGNGIPSGGETSGTYVGGGVKTSAPPPGRRTPPMAASHSNAPPCPATRLRVAPGWRSSTGRSPSMPARSRRTRPATSAAVARAGVWLRSPPACR